MKLKPSSVLTVVILALVLFYAIHSVGVQASTARMATGGGMTMIIE